MKRLQPSAMANPRSGRSMPQPNRGVLRLPRGGGRGAGLKRLALEMKSQGYSYRAVAAELALSLSTLKSWCRRAKSAVTVAEGRCAPLTVVDSGLPDTAPDVQPPVQPPAAQETAGDMQPQVKPGETQSRGRAGVGGRVGLPPAAAGPTMYRGVTREDLPGKSLLERSVNFRNLRKGTYPPRAWNIPGYLEGAELVEAIRAANAAKGRKKGKPEIETADETLK